MAAWKNKEQLNIMPTKKITEHYTVNEIVERKLLPFSAKTVRRLIACGKLKATSIALGEVARYRVSKVELERFAAKLAKKVPARNA